jgi:hypothetical protein
VCCTSANTTQLQMQILPSGRCLGIQCGCHTLAKGKPHTHTRKMPKTCLTPHHILLCDLYPNQMQLQHLQVRATGHDESAVPLASLPRLNQETIHHPNLLQSITMPTKNFFLSLLLTCSSRYPFLYSIHKRPMLASSTGMLLNCTVPFSD